MTLRRLPRPTHLMTLVAALLSLSLVTAAAPGSYSVYRSSDGGHTWTHSATGLPAASRINAFAATPSSFLAGTDQGLFLSRDQGRTWQPANAPLGRILAFATLGSTVFAGTERNGIALSHDAGAHWTFSETARFPKVRALLAHEGALYAGTDAQGLFVTRDAGFSWQPLNAGLPPGAQIFSLAGLPGRIFAALYGKGVYVLTPPSTTWRQAGDAHPLALASSGQTLLAGLNPGGILSSNDSGANWAPAAIAPSADLGKAPVWELAANQDVALAGISNGLYRSEDHGQHWTRATAGLPPNAAGIAFLLQPRLLLAAVFLPANP